MESPSIAFPAFNISRRSEVAIKTLTHGAVGQSLHLLHAGQAAVPCQRRRLTLERRQAVLATALSALSGIDSFILWIRQKAQPDPVGGD